MASYTWTGVSGDWNLASDWTPSGVPTASDNATINGSATTTITVDKADVADSLTLSDANATLNDDGSSASLTIGGTLTMSNGTLNVSPDYDDGGGGSLMVGALNLSGGALSINTQLNLNGTLSQTGGTLTLEGGTISGGTINSTGGTLAFVANYNILSGVTFDGPLNLTTSGVYAQTVQLANGTTVVGPSGSGPGTINVKGANSTVYFDNAQTVSNETINLVQGGALYENDPTGSGQVLTLASSVTVDVQGGNIYDGGYSGDGIVNEGVIDQTDFYENGLPVDGSLFIGPDPLTSNVGPNDFTNSGTINAEASPMGSSHATLFIGPSSTFTNSGTIDLANLEFAYIEPATLATTASSVILIGAGCSLTIGPANAWSNLGSITLANGAILIIQAPTSTTGLGSISNSGGTIELAEGNLNNSGDVLDGSSLGLTLAGGTITGGTLSGLAVTSYGGTLSGVTYEGTLNLSGEDANVSLASGTVVNNAAGTGAGTINDTGIDSFLYFDNALTFNNATINLGSSNVYGPSYLYENDTTGAGTVLTLASGVTIDESGSAYIVTGGDSGDGIVNQGAIKQSGTSSQLSFSGNALTNSGTITAAASSGGGLTIETTTFTNSGTITASSSGDIVTIDSTTFTNSGSLAVSNGDTATIDATTFTNLPAHTLTGGTYEAQAGSIIEIYGDDTIKTDDADIILSGAGSTIETYNTSTGAYGTIDQTLLTIGASGQLQLLAGRSWTTAGAAITNDGVIELGGGTLTATASRASLTDAAGSDLDGFGTLTATTFVNSGTVDASGGTLEVTRAVTGTGTDVISGAATLEFGAGVSTAKTLGHQNIDFAGAASLDLLDPRAFYGGISDFAAGDTVELKGSWAISAISEAAGMTTLTLASGSTTHGFEFVGDYTQSDFSITPKATTKIGYA